MGSVSIRILVFCQAFLHVFNGQFVFSVVLVTLIETLIIVSLDKSLPFP